MDPTSPAFWAALGSIVVANLLLSGDNAVVIALAARSLAPAHQRRAIVWGSAAAVAMRVALTVVAVRLLELPYLKLAGGVLLLWIGVTLLAGGDGEGGAAGRRAGTGVAGAIRAILVADLVMSLDNVIAVAAAARGDIVLLALGLAISIPLIVFGSTLLLAVMQRLPLLIAAGAALLGWLAGEMIATDPVVPRFVGSPPPAAVSALAAAGAIGVVALGHILRRRSARRERRHPPVKTAPRRMRADDDRGR